nr:hypothetical protein [uncultured Cupriavidus sp.]
MEADWTAIDVVRHILGEEAVSLDTSCTPGLTLVKEGEFFEFNNGLESQIVWDNDVPVVTYACSAPTVVLNRLDARSGRGIAGAAHEAFHAFLYRRFGGDVYRDEGRVNALAGDWVRHHLSGFRQHAAREMILESNISYGLN